MARPRSFNEDLVLDIVTRLFLKFGYTATSISMIMDATNLKKGSIYKAFESKENLFKLCLKRYMAQKFETMQSILEGSKTAFTALEYYLHHEVHVLRGKKVSVHNGHEGCLIINSMIENAPDDDDVRQALLRENEKYCYALADIIRQAQGEGYIRLDLDAEDIAKQTQLFLNTANIYMRAHMDPQDVRSYYNAFLKTISAT